MTMQRQIEPRVPILICLAAVASLSLLPASPARAQSFLDVPPSHWAYEFIEEMAASGITAGCGNGNYCPDATVTRAQMAVIIVRAMRRPRVVDGNGTILGDLLDVTGGDSAGHVGYTTRQGYVVRMLSAVTGALNDRWVFFTGENCTGTPYVDGMGGTVVGVAGSIYYADKNGVGQTNPGIVSRLDRNGSCVPGGVPITGAIWPALPNDPTVTGVSNTPYVVPIKIEQR